ncbi:hypothetical protein [Streptomyces antibioticus]
MGAARAASDDQAGSDQAAQLILNQLNLLVRTAVTIEEPELARTSAEAL